MAARQELRAFARVTLDAGTTTVVRLRLGGDDLAAVTRDLRFAVEPGRYEVEAGESSGALRAAVLDIV
ncbi:hypothetical protein GCM10018793_09520 [Streptomyces sulfonofaciens]|uniref:Fibronectin type III-like domain-containing protein n=1 Tax=Streptomyces sulfonofaciens TaxID=68272 RepID=A0A919FV14_9ACTN|nr:hypothetical protein GCM10018793_09520 [Streptomyces sulfonofaciens]